MGRGDLREKETILPKETDAYDVGLVDIYIVSSNLAITNIMATPMIMPTFCQKKRTLGT